MRKICSFASVAAGLALLISQPLAGTAATLPKIGLPTVSTPAANLSAVTTPSVTVPAGRRAVGDHPPRADATGSNADGKHPVGDGSEDPTLNPEPAVQGQMRPACVREHATQGALVATVLAGGLVRILKRGGGR